MKRSFPCVAANFAALLLILLALPTSVARGQFAGLRNRPAQVAPDQQAAALPAFLQPGARITFHVGDSVIPGVRSKLVQDENGRWVDPATGKRYSDNETRGSGGVAFYQVDILHASPNFIAADGRSYLISDQQNNISSPSGAQAVMGDGGTLADIWIHPARLAQIPNNNDPSNRVSRIQYTTGNQTFDAISLASTGADHFSVEIYDLESGLLLSRGTSNTGAGVTQMGPNNTPIPGGGSTAISHARFVGIRQISLPWAAEPAPDWAVQGRQIDYQGQVRVLTGNTGLPPLPGQPVTISYQLQQAGQGCVSAASYTRFDNGQGIPPSEVNGQRCFGSAMVGGLWLAPQIIGQLQEGQVIDEDPITRRRTTFAGMRGGLAVIAEQGPIDLVEYAYNPQDGMLTGSRNTEQMLHIGQRIIEFGLSQVR